MNIRKLIGEATAYDKKQQLEIKRPKSWLKSVSAFANGEGGTLVFGISDDDQVVGLADAESDAERISEEIKTKLSRIFCTRWNGLDMTSGLGEALDDAELEGSVIGQLQDAVAFVRNV